MPVRSDQPSLRCSLSKSLAKGATFLNWARFASTQSLFSSTRLKFKVCASIWIVLKIGNLAEILITLKTKQEVYKNYSQLKLLCLMWLTILLALTCLRTIEVTSSIRTDSPTRDRGLNHMIATLFKQRRRNQFDSTLMPIWKTLKWSQKTTSPF